MKFDDISEVAGPKNCWPGYRKVGTKPGTGKNAGKRVNDCEKIKKESALHQAVKEFAPSFAGGDDGNDGFSEETLKRLAAQWWKGDEDPRVERTLMAAGWEIGQDEGYDEGGVFVVQSGDVNGKSYISWSAEDLEGMAEGIGDEVNPADVGEYDREGDMAQSQLKTAEDAAAELRSILDADENLPEWVQSKITKAVDYLDTARDYMKSEKQGVAEGWKEEAQELEDWSKEVNMRLYRAHESQRPALARQLSKLEQKHFGSEFTHPNLTNIVWSALRALQKGDMVHYDPQRVGQMPFGNIVGDDAKIIAQYNITRDELAGYRMLHDKGMVDNLEQFLKLRRLVRAKSWPLEYYEELEQLTPEEAWLKMANDLNWSKDGMNEEVQAKTDDKLLAYYAQRKADAEKKKKEQGMMKDNSALGQAVKEAGWGRRYTSYHDELSSRERDEQNAMDQSKRDFKRAELQHELGHEDDPNFERNLRQQQIDRDRGPWYIRIDGKIYRQKGQPKSFDWKRGANNYALAMVKNNPSLQGKIMLSKSAEDK
jgi:hypothetical protein